MIEARTADITINNKTIGQLGEIKPQVLETLGIKVPLAVLEIDINELI
jgi:phenylalanyl-tRNA synthetase beta subunit